MVQQKRSSWVYIVLGLMLFSLIIFSGIPLFSSIFTPEQLTSNSAQAIATFTARELVKLEAEASGYQKVLEREPENDTALRGLLEIRLKQKDLPGAIAPLEKLAQIHAQQSDYTILLAQAKQQITDYEGAAAAYRQVLATHPGDIFALGGITNLFLIQNLPERAIAILKDTIKLAQKDDSETSQSIDVASVELLLGELYVSQERYDEAIALYDELAQAKESDFRPVFAKALVLERQDKIEAAKSALETAYTIAPAEYKDQIGNEMKRLNRSTVGDNGPSPVQ
ncbi:MAG: tetratricopeptide repeat protein [Pleurocapsa sp.]